MPVEFNHTIVLAKDNHASARFLAELLGLEVGEEWGPFVPVALSNGVTLDFATSPVDPIPLQHYAFLVTEAEFDAVLARIEAAGLDHYADPRMSERGINRNDGGRGTYFLDPGGHGMEVITRPYGSGGGRLP
ncbi:MAG TPA: VOC family protein [Pseudonocardiaceae bacterium]